MALLHNSADRVSKLFDHDDLSGATMWRKIAEAVIWLQDGKPLLTTER